VKPTSSFLQTKLQHNILNLSLSQNPLSGILPLNVKHLSLSYAPLLLKLSTLRETCESTQKESIYWHAGLGHSKGTEGTGIGSSKSGFPSV